MPALNVPPNWWKSKRPALGRGWAEGQDRGVREEGATENPSLRPGGGHLHAANPGAAATAGTPLVDTRGASSGSSPPLCSAPVPLRPEEMSVRLPAPSSGWKR